MSCGERGCSGWAQGLGRPWIHITQRLSVRSSRPSVRLRATGLTAHRRCNGTCKADRGDPLQWEQTTGASEVQWMVRPCRQGDGTHTARSRSEPAGAVSRWQAAPARDSGHEPGCAAMTGFGTARSGKATRWRWCEMKVLQVTAVCGETADGSSKHADILGVRETEPNAFRGLGADGEFQTGTLPR